MLMLTAIASNAVFLMVLLVRLSPVDRNAIARAWRRAAPAVRGLRRERNHGA